MIFRNKILKIRNFSFCLKLDPEMPEVIKRCCYSYYLIPEVIKREPYGNLSESWLVGCIIYELLFSQKISISLKTLKNPKISKSENYEPNGTYSTNLVDSLECLLRLETKNRLNFQQFLYLFPVRKMTLAFENNPKNSKILVERYNEAFIFSISKPFLTHWKDDKIKGRLNYMAERKPVGDKISKEIFFSEENLFFL